MEIYKESETTLVATWIRGDLGHYWRCSNCGKSVSVPYQRYSVELGKYCLCCGAHMTNPEYINLNVDYD